MDSEVCEPQPWSSELSELTPLTEYYLIIISFVAWGWLMLALVASRWLRAKFFGENEETEETYRDGGRRTSGLIVTFFIAKLFLHASFFEATRIVAQNGVSGAYFHSLAACVAITAMAPLAMELKTKAPGARTFLQVVRTRFGARVHCLFCVCALLMNFGIICEICSRYLVTLMKSASTANKELLLATILFSVAVALAFGGISSVFNNSYIITTLLVFTVVLIGDAVFLSNSPYPLVYMVYMVLNQSYWQGVMNSGPETGGFNLLAGGFFFFPVGTVLGTACGLGYLALNMSYGQVMLSPAMERLGLMVYSVVDFLFAHFGTVLLDLVIISSMITAISSEVMSISSILVVDVYMTYVRPFKKTAEMNSCVLCGLERARAGEYRERCQCKSMAACTDCQQDDRDQKLAHLAVNFRAKCSIHGDYRRYIERTKTVRTYAVYIVLASFICASVLLEIMQVSMLDLSHCLGIVCGSAVGGVYFAFFWPRVTSAAVIVGTSVSAICGGAALIAAYLSGLDWRGGGTMGTIVAGALVTVIFTLCTTRPLSEEEALEVWEKTRSIDDPLRPWSETYSRDLGIRNAHLLAGGRPRLDDVRRAFSYSSKILTYTILLLAVLYVVILPAIVLIPPSLSPGYFQVIMYFLLTWLSTSFMFLLIIPLVFGWDKAKSIRKKQRDKDLGTRGRPECVACKWSASRMQKVANFLREMAERTTRLCSAIVRRRQSRL